MRNQYDIITPLFSNILIIGHGAKYTGGGTCYLNPEAVVSSSSDIVAYMTSFDGLRICTNSSISVTSPPCSCEDVIKFNICTICRPRTTVLQCRVNRNMPIPVVNQVVVCVPSIRFPSDLPAADNRLESAITLLHIDCITVKSGVL